MPITAVMWSVRERSVDIQARPAFRVLWLTTVKACLNTLMVLTGWKKSSAFKVRPHCPAIELQLHLSMFRMIPGHEVMYTLVCPATPLLPPCAVDDPAILRSL